MKVARFINYKCPDCDGVFRHLQHPSDAPPPDRCPLCGSWVSTDAPPEPVFVPQAPLIRENAYAKSIDQVYRAQEAASIERAADAVATLEAAYAADKTDGPDTEAIDRARKAELLGLRSGLKVTNMQDPSSMREGDISAIAPTPPPLTTGGAAGGFQNLGGVVPNYAPTSPTTGEPTRQAIVSDHRTRAETMTARGMMHPPYFDRR